MTREEELDLEEKDLYDKLNKIKTQKEEIRQQKIEEKKKEIGKKLDYIREHQDIILSLIKHDRTSCSDDYPCNGYNYNRGYARCNKCYLIEILNGEWENEIDVNFSVGFTNVKNLI